jgi:hypothetical protein
MIMTRWARKASSWEATEELQLCFSNALNSYDFLLQQSTSESETSVQCKSLEQTSYLPVNLMVCINLLTFCSRLVWSLRGTESAYASGCDSELTALIFFLNHVSNVNSSTKSTPVFVARPLEASRDSAVPSRRRRSWMTVKTKVACPCRVTRFVMRGGSLFREIGPVL